MPATSSHGKLKLPPHPGQNGPQKTVEFSVMGATLPDTVSPALTAACHLIPCMAAHFPLELPGPLDARLAAGLPRLMELLSRWNSKLRPVALKTPDASSNIEPAKPGRGVAACFTGGVDSFYTLVTRRKEIDTLVYVLGYDLQRKQAKLWD